MKITAIAIAVLFASICSVKSEDEKDKRDLLANVLKAEVGLGLADPISSLFFAKEGLLDAKLFKTLLSSPLLAKLLALNPLKPLLLGDAILPLEGLKEAKINSILSNPELLKILLAGELKHLEHHHAPLPLPLPVPVPVPVPKPIPILEPIPVHKPIIPPIVPPVYPAVYPPPYAAPARPAPYG